MQLAKDSSLGFVGTMADTLIVETMKREVRDGNRVLQNGAVIHDASLISAFGNLQAHCWIALFVGNLLGNPLGPYAHESLGDATAGMRAALQAWASSEYQDDPPIHSKCVGFALPGGE